LALVPPPFINGRLNTAVWIPPMMARMKELEAEDAQLKKIYNEEKLKAKILNEAISQT
jgi:hypothetical protein